MNRRVHDVGAERPRSPFRLLCLVATSVIFAACDPGYMISASRSIRSGADQACVLTVLREQSTVRAAGIDERGQTFADVIVPERLGYHKPVWRTDVELRRRSNGE